VRPPTVGAADVDRFLALHRPTWDRLAALLRRAGRDPRRLSPAELDELVRLHLRTSSHLSTVRTELHDPDLTAWLSSLVARSSAIVHGSRPRTWSTLLRGVGEVLPAAVWHVRVHVLAATGLFVIVTAAVTVWLGLSDAAVELALPEAAGEAYLERDFEGYYSSEPGTTFAARVFTNNVAVGALAFGAGVAWGLPTIGVLALNAANLGVAAGLFHAAGDAGRFWGLILPHGLLELTAVFLAAGAGLSLGWSVIDPGDRSRRASLAEAGRRAVVILLGLVGVFLIAGLLEAFVTPASAPTWVRVGTGAVVWVAVLAHLVVRGRRAASRGLTGLPEEASTPTTAR
jgi:uncharacterized membrane protein SpoIIM required for sporulation